MIPDGQRFSHYRLLKPIDSKETGEVYLVEDVLFPRQLAIKIVRIAAIQPDRKAVIRALRLFLRAAPAIAKLDHANILPLYEYGETTLDGSQVVYLTMPYRSEGSLGAWLRQRAQNQPEQQLTPQQIIHIVRQAGAALQYAHDHQIMHLDVKPANFLIRSRSTIDDYPDLLLSDLGVAHLTGATASSKQQVHGTPTYLAPEQCNNRPVFASDQYTLGILAYELLTGNPPFQGEPQDVISAHIHEQPEPVRDLMPLLPPDVDLVLQRALAKKPKQRFPSVAAFTQAFQAALQNAPAEAIIQPLHPESASLSDTSPTAGDLYGTLTISAQEALDGAVRTLNMPDKPAINVQIPAGAQDEQVLVLTGQGEVPAPGVAAGNLYLTLLLSQSQEQITPAPVPGAPKRARSPLIVIMMLLLLLSGGGLSAYSAITNNWPLLQNIFHGPAIPITSNLHAQALASTPRPMTGQAWHPQLSGTSQELMAVVWADTQFVVVGNLGTILTSPDGITWTARNSGTSQDLWNVAWSGSLFVAVGTGGTILTSPNGITWTIQHSASSQDLWSAAWVDSFLFVATGTNGTILTSRDGHTWTARHAGTGEILDGVAWSGSLLMVVGTGGTILTSSDDGNTWTVQNSGTTQDLWDVAWVDAQFVVTGTNGTILTSAKGTTWTTQRSNVTQNLSGVAWSGSQLAIVGDSGTILTSPNGRTWTIQRSGTTLRLLNIARSSATLLPVPLFVAVGDQGTILTSP